MNDEEQKKRLIDQGAEKLADALINLSLINEDADDLVKRLISTPKENIKRFKSKLAGLKRSKQFIHYGESFAFSRKLEGFLSDLQAGVSDPKTGVELVAGFFECDQAVLGHCDDSSGSVADVYKLTAREMFVHYASKCDNKAWLCDLLTDLYADDDYGIRDCLINAAGKFLPQENMRDLADRFWARSQKEKPDSSEERHWIYGVEFLARQLKDAKLFEKARLAAHSGVSVAACVDIAQVYLETGDAQTALSWVQRVPENEQFQLDERHELLLAIYEQLGQKEEMQDIAWRILRRRRSERNLEKLLKIIGEEERERVIDGQVQRIWDARQFSYPDADFLIEVGRMDDAERYILNFTEQLNGDCYTLLLPIAQGMEKAGYWLTAYVIYRALLESILGRAQSKYYNHGVRYLKKLDNLSSQITDWQKVMPYAVYKQELTKTHFRKKAFWTKYEGE